MTLIAPEKSPETSPETSAEPTEASEASVDAAVSSEAADELDTSVIADDITDTAPDADSSETADEPEAPRVVMWSKRSGCVQCTATYRRIEESGLPAEIHYFEDNPEKLEEFKNRGFMSAPVMVTDDEIWAGFRPDKLDPLIAEWKADQLLASGEITADDPEN
jgi:glutaredoxin-like protein NrdH